MTEEAQRIAIAESLGWQALPTHDGYWRIKPPKPNQIVAERFETKEAGLLAYAPDFLHDLNAMHDAEKALTIEQCHDYHAEIQRLGFRQGDVEPPVDNWTLHATAALRAQAFLRTIGLWTET